MLEIRRTLRSVHDDLVCHLFDWSDQLRWFVAFLRVESLIGQIGPRTMREEGNCTEGRKDHKETKTNELFIITLINIVIRMRLAKISLMTTLMMERANAWSQIVIGAAIEVHRIKGPGLLEEIYSKCLGRECELWNIPFVKELRVSLEYKGLVFEQSLRVNILIDNLLIVELKAVEKVLPIHKAQLLSYLKLLNKPLGLLINFHEPILKNGIYRMMLKGADST